MFEYLSPIGYIIVAISATLLSFYFIIRSVRSKGPFELVALWCFAVLTGISATAVKLLNIYQHPYEKIAVFIMIGAGVLFMIFLFALAFNHRDKYGNEKHNRFVKWYLVYVIIFAIASVYILLLQ